MIKGFRHTGIVVHNLEKVCNFYVSLGFSIKSQALEKGAFIEQVTGLKNVNLKWIKMNLPDGTLLELLKYDSPKLPLIKEKQIPNKYGVSHMAFTVNKINDFCKEVVNSGGSIVNIPALTNNKKFKVVYCHDVEGNLFEAVEII